MKPLPDLLHRSLDLNYLIPDLAVVLKCLIAERRALGRCIDMIKAFGAELAGEVLIDWHESIGELFVLKQAITILVEAQEEHRAVFFGGWDLQSLT